MTCSGVSPASDGSALTPVTPDAARHWFEKGNRTVVNPICLMCCIPPARVMVSRPCGAHDDVSMPNQAMPRIVYGAPEAVTIFPPAVCSHPGDEAAATGPATVAAETGAANAADVVPTTNARRRTSRSTKDARTWRNVI